MKTSTWILTFALFGIFPTFGLSQTFTVDDPSGRDTIRFVLDAPLEVINGISNTVKGSFEFKQNKAKGSFQVPVTSITTGITKRDEHLQNDKWLDAKKFPQLVFTVTNLEVPASLWEGGSVTLEAKGEFEIHGKKKSQMIKMQLNYLKESDQTRKRLPGNLLRVKASFPIQLKDFEIAQSDSAVKGLLGLKVGEVAEVSVDLMATDKSTKN